MNYTIGFNGLPFGIDIQQVIYVDNQYDAVVNDFIVRNYEAICDHFASRGYEFVYLLFLRHPEGILFKHLTDYSAELEQIYTHLRGGVLTDQMHQSVMLVTSPLNNSINEKCARIREAFISKFEESLAEPYIVRGQRGCPKSIPFRGRWWSG